MRMTGAVEYRSYPFTCRTQGSRIEQVTESLILGNTRPPYQSAHTRLKQSLANETCAACNKNTSANGWFSRH